MDFGKVLTRSWEIIWKYKALWIFGILASCGANFNFGGRFNYRVGQRDFSNLPPEMQRFFEQWSRNFEQLFKEHLGVIIAIVCIAILIGILFWVLGVFGKVGLIQGVNDAEGGKDLGFRMLAGESWKKLGKALGLSVLLVLLPLAVILLIVVISIIFGAATLGFGFICLIPLICLLVPAFLLYYVYTEMAVNALITDDLGVGDALSSGWEVFRDNLGNLIGMGLILLVGGILVGIIVSLPVIAIMAPAFFGMISDQAGAFGRGFLISAILFVIALPFLVLINGIIRSYIQSAWTLTYRQLTGTKPNVVRAKANS